MHTLQEFLLHTKGLCYIAAGFFLVAFIPFWLFLTARQGKN
jgi:hypothetical protein